MKILFQFQIIFRIRENEMFIDLLSESCDSRNLARKGGISLLGDEDEPVFQG